MFDIAKEIEGKNLLYFEKEITFNAKVPYDLGIDLEEAKKLSEISNIEEKAFLVYKKVNEWIVTKNLKRLSEFRRDSDIRYCKAFYINNKEDMEKEFDYSFLFENNSKPLELKNYEVKFYANDRIIELIDKNTKGDLISLKGLDEDNDEVVSSLVLRLYMPRNSDELIPF